MEKGYIMRRMMKLLATAITVTTMFTITNSEVLAAPYNHKKQELIQPDGTFVQVDITGDEYYQHIESPDGYTLFRDEDGWICYAELNEDETDYVSTGIVYKAGDNRRTVNSIDQVDQRNNRLEKHLKIKNEAVKKKADEVRKRLHGSDFRTLPNPTAKTATDYWIQK